MRCNNHGPLATIERLLDATNAHDVEGVVGCFSDDYRLEVPAHPARSFRGNDQVRRNWTQIFEGVPNISARLLRTATDGDADSVWTEWEMSGTRRDGGAHAMRGVFIFGITDGLIRWGRMFLEPLDGSPQQMDGALAGQLAPGAPDGTR
jgi:ketosteroid isomerase-like protein